MTRSPHRLFGICLLPLAIVACGPQAIPHDLDTAAEALLDIHNGAWGSQDLAETFFVHPQGVPERMDWFRRAVGTCTDYEVIADRGPTRARFLYHCKHGQLEAELYLDEQGRVTKMHSGARDVAPPLAVRAVATQVMIAPPRGLGIDYCRMNRVDLVSQSGALFVLSCPEGERTMILDLDQDAQVRRLHVVDHATDEWREFPSNST